MVGERGLEPPASASRTLRANQLRYSPHKPIIIVGFNFQSNNCKLIDYEILRGNHGRGFRLAHTRMWQ